MDEIKEIKNEIEHSLRALKNKRIELIELQQQYSQLKAKERIEVFKTAQGMDKSLYLLKQNFESSSIRTPQYLEFHRIFKSEFTKLLKPCTTKIEFSKPNHFDVSGFFELKSGIIYNFFISDLRWSKDSMVIRTATDFKDYSGGSNNFIILDKNFISNLFKFLKITP